MTDEPTEGTDLNTQLSALVRQAVGEALASFQPLQAPPPVVTPFLTTTPKLGLKMPALDDPALIQDINDNSVILDDAITATVTATLYNKTLEAPILNNPTINGWGNLDHTHLDTNSGGALDGAAITTGDIGTGYLTRESHVADQISLALTGGGADLVSPDLIDAVVRDTLWWGPTPTGAPDASLKRTGAGALRVDSHLGVGVNPSAWHPDYPAVQVGKAGAVAGSLSTTHAFLASNTYFTASGGQAIAAGAGVLLELQDGGVTVRNAPSVAAGSVQALTTRLALAPTGTLTLTPDSGQPDLVLLGDRARLYAQATSALGLARFGMEYNTSGVVLSYNIRTDPAFSGSGWGKDNITEGAWVQSMHTTHWTVSYSKSGPANPAVLLNRFQMDNNGTLILTPDAASTGLALNMGSTAGSYPIRMGTWWFQKHGNLGTEFLLEIGRDFAPVGSVLYLDAVNGQCKTVGHWLPMNDQTGNLGLPATKWAAVYAANGTIQTSTYEMKEGFGPLDPAACAQAVLETDWVEFRYRPPAYPYTDPDEAPEGKDATLWRETLDQTRAAHAKIVVETAPARHQKGYVLQSPAHKTADLFGLDDRENTSVASDLAVVACALQGALQRIAQLEAAQAPTGTTTSRRSRAA